MVYSVVVDSLIDDTSSLINKETKRSRGNIFCVYIVYSYAAAQCRTRMSVVVCDVFPFSHTHAAAY